MAEVINNDVVNSEVTKNNVNGQKINSEDIFNSGSSFDNEPLIKRLIHQVKWACSNSSYLVMPNFYFHTATTIKLGKFSFDEVLIQNFSNERKTLEGSNYKEESSYNPISKITRYGFLIDNGLFISVRRNQLKKLKDYMLVSTDDTNNYNGVIEFIDPILILPKSINLSIITNKIKTLKNDLVNKNKLHKLSDESLLILDLPIILWKLGWHHAALCQFNLLNKGNSIQFNANWIESYSRAKTAHTFILQNLTKAVQSHKLTEFYSNEKRCRDNLDYLKKKGKNMKVGDSFSDLNIIDMPKTLDDKVPQNFNYSVSIGSPTGDLDDLGGALGRFRIVAYFKGILSKIDDKKIKLNIDSIILRFSDAFTFRDDPLSIDYKTWVTQPLGIWRFDVYDVAKPNSSLVSNFFTSKNTDSYNIALSNEIYMRFFNELGFSDYSGFLSYSEQLNFEFNYPFELWYDLK
jgi:Family of unknown function (DUF6402)